MLEVGPFPDPRGDASSWCGFFESHRLVLVDRGGLPRAEAGGGSPWVNVGPVLSCPHSSRGGRRGWSGTTLWELVDLSSPGVWEVEGRPRPPVHWF